MDEPTLGKILFVLVVRDRPADERGFKRFGFGNGMLFGRLGLEPAHDAGGSCSGGCHKFKIISLT
jgi:hypothetical protein